MIADNARWGHAAGDAISRGGPAKLLLVPQACTSSLEAIVTRCLSRHGRTG